MTLEQLQHNLTMAEVDLAYARAYANGIAYSVELVRRAGMVVPSALECQLAWARGEEAKAQAARDAATEAHRVHLYHLMGKEAPTP